MSAGPVLVSAVGGAEGARAAAAALACAGGEDGRPGLLIELAATRPPRPGLFSTVEARRLEERLAAHLPESQVASRGRICVLAPSAGEQRAEELAGALAIGRDAATVVHAAPAAFRLELERCAGRVEAVLLRAELDSDRALTGLAAAELAGRGLRVEVLKRPLGWLAARCALAGSLPAGAGGLPPRLVRRLMVGAPERADP